MQTTARVYGISSSYGLSGAFLGWQVGAKTSSSIYVMFLCVAMPAVLKALGIIAGRFCNVLFPGHQGEGSSLLSASLRAKGIGSVVVTCDRQQGQSWPGLEMPRPYRRLSTLHGRLELCLATCNMMALLVSHWA